MLKFLINRVIKKFWLKLTDRYYYWPIYRRAYATKLKMVFLRLLFVLFVFHLYVVSYYFLYTGLFYISEPMADHLVDFCKELTELYMYNADLAYYTDNAFTYVNAKVKTYVIWFLVGFISKFLTCWIYFLKFVGFVFGQEIVFHTGLILVTIWAIFKKKRIWWKEVWRNFWK